MASRERKKICTPWGAGYNREEKAITTQKLEDLYHIRATMGGYKGSPRRLTHEVILVGTWLLYNSAYCAYGYLEFDLL